MMTLKSLLPLRWSSTILLSLLFSTVPILSGIAQSENPALDSIQTLLDKHPQSDSIRVKLLLGLADQTVNDYKRKRDIAEQARQLSRQIGYEPGEAAALLQIGVGYRMAGNLQQALNYGNQVLKMPISKNDHRILAMSLNLVAAINKLQGDYPQALRNYLQALQAAEQSGVPKQIANALLNIGNLYATLEDLPKALSYQFRSLTLWEQLGDKLRMVICLNNIGEDYSLMGDYPKAVEFYKRTISLAQSINYMDGQALAQSNLADVYLKTGNTKEAFALAYAALGVVKSLDDQQLIAWCSDILARTHLQTDGLDSARFYGLQALRIARQTGIKEYIRDAGSVLSKVYARQADYANAYNYQQLYITYNDSLANEATRKQVSRLQFDYELAQKESRIALLTKDKNLQAETTRRQRQLLSAVVVGLVLTVLLALVLWRSNHVKQRTNTLLHKQKQEIDQQARHLQELNEELNAQNEEVESQRDHLNVMLQELRSTQAQLIQKEKMASLGELTAGIAHEIQNPLNFVNNFSETNRELIEELQAAAQAGTVQEVIAIASDIRANEEKIAHHGKRAESIVKGMLQHARVNTSENQPTDINNLVDEYLRLSFQGLRAKDKSFQATIQTLFDEEAGQVAVVPQDIGRVLLNLFNNAFYAVSKKKEQLNGTYEPMVSISTKKEGNNIRITVKDNGTGMSPRVAEKIFQPFFTTKPTGEGTGLGLSLSYDIITKGHSGTIYVDSKDGQGSQFVITLPININTRQT